MKTTLEWQDEIVLLPVPLRYAQQVAEFSASLAAGLTPTTPESAADGEEAVVVPGQGAWTTDMVDRLADAVTYEAVLALMDSCASQRGQWVPKSEVEEVHSFSAIQLRNELGALSKKSIKLFGEAIWPMEWKKERGAYSYRMDTVVAQWWTDARKGTIR
ncbi:hypothetical protein [Pedococcus soli]